MPTGFRPGRWLELRVTVPVAAQEAVTAWMLDRGAAGVQEEYPGLGLDLDGPLVSGDPTEWRGEAPANPNPGVTLIAWIETDGGPAATTAALQAAVRDAAGAEAAATASVKAIEDCDWSAAWKADWKPTPAGRSLMICPSWLEPPPGDRVVLRIDPGMAFGTGTHFTTAGCLELLEDALGARGAGEAVAVLDVGTGSGILAIAALKLGAARALGIDVDPDAVQAAVENAAANGVGDRFTARIPAVGPADGTFQVVLANILAHTLIELAPSLAAAVAPGGELIVSGVIDERADDVDTALQAQGLAQVRLRRGDGWVAAAYARTGAGEWESDPNN